MPTIANLTVDVEARTSQFNSALRGAGVALGALAVGAGVAFREFEDAQKVSNQTAAVLKSTGGAAKVTQGQIEDLAGALSEKAAIDDEVIQSGQNLLLTFKNIRNETGKGNDIFNQATTAIVDMSAAMDQDLKSSAIQVGKALNDPVAGMSALTRVGVQFSEEQKTAIERMAETGDILGAQKIILRELDSQFAGSAAAQATASDRMRVAFGNLTEALGGVVAAGLTPLLNALGPVFRFLERFPGVTATIIAGVVSLTAAFKVWRAWTLLTAAAQGVLLAAMPWALIAAAVVALVVVVVKNWDKIKAFVLGVWDAIKEKTAGVRAFMVGVWNFLKSVVLNVWAGIRAAAIGAINFVVAQLNRLIGAVNRVQDVLDTLAGPGINFEHVGNIPGLATGGTVTRTGLAVVHRGEEFSGVSGNRGRGRGIYLDRRHFSGALATDHTYRGW